MIVTEAELPQAIATLAGMRIVFTVGSFDLLHTGHIGYLEWCAQHGDALVVAVNNDASISRDKGAARPILPERERAIMVNALRVVDITVISEAFTGVPHEESIQTALRCRPQVVVLGHDWGPAELSYWKRALPEATIVICPKRHAAGRGTTELLASIMKKCSPGHTMKA